MSYDLTNLPHPVVVFEIDDDTFHGHAKFMRKIDTLRAMGKLSGDVEQGMGHWQGVNSICYVVSEQDAQHIIPDIKGQDAIMLVFTDGRVEMRNECASLLDSGVIVDFAADRLGKHPGFTILKSGMYAMI